MDLFKTMRLILAAALLAFAAPAFAQAPEAASGETGTVAGCVTDVESGEGLPAANVVLVGTVRGAATDIDGCYTMLNVPVGEYALEFAFIGFERERVASVAVLPGETTRVNADLVPDFTLGCVIVCARPRIPLLQAGPFASRTILAQDGPSGELLLRLWYAEPARPHARPLASGARGPVPLASRQRRSWATPPPPMDFPTLHALAREWHARWRGATVTGAWTQSPSELTLALQLASGGEEGRDKGQEGASGEEPGSRSRQAGEAHPEPGTQTTDAFRALCDGGLPMVWRQPGGGRQRRNTTDVLPELVGRTLEAVRTPERDRFLVLHFDGGLHLWVRLFGPRPNAFLLRTGVPIAVFLGDELEVPTTRPAPHPETPEALASRWRPRKRLSQAVGAAVPLISAPLAADACRRAGLDPDMAPEAIPPEGLWRGVQSVLEDLAQPTPHIAWRGTPEDGLPEALLPAPLAHPPEDWTLEAFESFDRAASVFARRTLGSRHYRSLYAPVEKPLARLTAKRQRSADAMLDELSQPSRADGYEAWGHLLMAQASGEGPGREEIALPDIMGDPSETVTIPLDPALSAIENAERYYDKARRTRRSREEAEGRWESAHSEAEELQDLLARLRATATLDELRTLLEAEDATLARVLRPEARGETSEPFHRFPLPGGFEALVGKHARGNAHLTTRVASPHDLWLHARGVPGSHVVIKRGARTVQIPPEAVGQAARLAARFSTAKTQSQVPVQVTERKYVRPIKGGKPGLVRVDREDVLLVEPAVL